MKISPTRFLLLLLVIVCASSAVSAKDDWTQVRSKNFFLIGNASEKDIRKVATRLEEFRETFSLLFKGLNLQSPIETNVVVFKSDSSYKDFKPKRADGKIDTFVAGYFQPGEDVNYISLAVGGEDGETYKVIFHEYVHSIINTNFGKSEVPPWFNEGLAEFYSTFAIENDQVVKLGLLIQNHLNLLRQSKLIPLDQLFAVKNRQLLNQGDHSRSIFYAESWALIHYLIQGGKGPALNKFLGAVLKQVPQEKAFKDAFQEDYASMQKQLENYVGQSKYQGTMYTFEKKLTFENEMQSSPLSPAMSNAYLGDLLYHADRADDSEPFLVAALKEEPGISMASTDMGMVKLKQRKFDEARTYLETAVKGEQKTAHALYRYAYLLSREGSDDYGIRHEYSSETVTKMRDALNRAIAAQPTFTPSYDLLAYLDLTAHSNLDEAAKAMQAAVKFDPGSDEYALRLAEIYMQQEKYDDARKIADRILHTSDDAEVQQRSGKMIEFLDERANYEKQRAAYEQRGNTSGRPTLRRDSGAAPMTKEELDKANKSAELQSINGALRAPQAGEKRLVGAIERVDCARRPIAFTVRSGDETFVVTSADFNGLTLNAFDRDTSGMQVGCDAKLAAFTAVITYKEGPPSINNKGPRGQLLAIEFVPDDFHLLSEAEMTEQHTRLVRRTETDADSAPTKSDEPQTGGLSTTAPTPDEMRNAQRDAVRQGMRSALRQPAEGEKRELAYLDKIDCTSKGNYFVFHNTAGTLRLLNDKAENLHIIMYTRDLEGLQIGCTLKPVEYPAVIVYKPSGDPKSKSQGIIVSMEFVPKDFTLE